MTDNRADASLTTPEALAVSLTINGTRHALILDTGPAGKLRHVSHIGNPRPAIALSRTRLFMDVETIPRQRPSRRPLLE